MDDVLVAEEFEGLQNLNCEAANEGQGYAAVVVVLDKLVQVDGE